MRFDVSWIPNVRSNPLLLPRVVRSDLCQALEGSFTSCIYGLGPVSLRAEKDERFTIRPPGSVGRLPFRKACAQLSIHSQAIFVTSDVLDGRIWAYASIIDQNVYITLYREGVERRSTGSKRRFRSIDVDLRRDCTRSQMALLNAESPREARSTLILGSKQSECTKTTSSSGSRLSIAPLHLVLQAGRHSLFQRSLLFQ